MTNSSLSHFYELPDGRKALNMLEGCRMIGKGTDAFRSLVKKGIIKKYITNQKLKSDEKNVNYISKTDSPKPIQS
jgi:hypothetical protein